MKYLIEFFFSKNILNRKYKIFSFFLIITLIVVSILEMMSIGIIIPVLGALLDPGNDKLSFIKENINFTKKFSNNDYIIFLICVFIFIFAIKNIFILFQNYIQVYFIKKLTLLIQYKMIHSYSKKNILFFKNTNSSEILRDFQSELIIFTNVVINKFFIILSELFVLVGIIGLVFYIEPKISFVMIIFFLSISLVYYITIQKKLNKYGIDRHFYSKETLKVLSELINLFPQIKLLDKKDFFFSRVSDSFSKVIVSITKKSFYVPILRLLIEFSLVLFIGSLIIFLVINQKNLNEIITFVGILAAAAFRLLPSIIRLNNSLHELKYHLPSAKVIIKNLENDKNNNFQDNLKKDDIPEFQELKIKNLSFSFDQKIVFEKINFEIKKNKIYGIIGQSGYGKTTFLNILTGLYDVETEIIYNKKIKLSNFKILQRQMCYVPQNVYLYDDSILNNITLGDKLSNNSSNRIEKIFKRLGLTDFINNLPENLNTIVGENGTKLSGGQVQRIGIARALYHKKKIIFLDEFTSSLDNQTETELLEYLKEISNETTIILVTHRKQPLKICDEIYEIENKVLKKVNNENIDHE